MHAIAAILLLLFTQQKTPDKELKGDAAKCGTEIPWLTSLTEAQKQSKATGKPIAWWVTRIEDSPMDRKLVIEKSYLSKLKKVKPTNSPAREKRVNRP